MDDEALLSAYTSGQQPAFEELYLRHRDALYRFILRQCQRNTEQAEEIFQDIWINVIRSNQQFRGDARFSTYLYQIARNKIIDHARIDITHKASAHDNNSDELTTSDKHQPEQQTQFELCIELLQQYIQKLPEEQREIFILKQETEHTLDELAQITQTSFETIKSRLRYAMKKLRDWLPGDCL